MKSKLQQLILKAGFCLVLMMAQPISAQRVQALWVLNDTNNAESVQLTGEEQHLSQISTTFTVGSHLSVAGLQTSANADEGYEGITYETPFMKFQPDAEISGKTTGYSINFSISVAEGHTFKPTTIAFDAIKCGTDGGGIDLYIKSGDSNETAFKTGLIPLRNKITASNSTGYSSFEYPITDLLLEGESFTVSVYLYGITTNKQLAFRNVRIEGMVDEPIYNLSHYVTGASCSIGDLYETLKGLKNGETATWNEKLKEDPTDFVIATTEGYSANITYEKPLATISITDSEKNVVFKTYLRFTVTNRNHGTAKPLNRGLVAVPASSTGVFVGWRKRASDDKSVSYRLFRDGVEVGTYELTNIVDASGTRNSIYSLEVLRNGEVIERQDGVGVWNNFYRHIPLKTPTDERGLGATYTPNDCSVYDMDGDGEYEIIVKWDPDNSKDSASSGTTSSVYIDCYKMDGTLMWRINLGQNIRAGAHYTQFLCYDFDGDGFGEMICKTAPGTIDGENNFVLMNNDDPTASYINSKGHIISGPEYLSIFDGVTGGVIHTVKYEPAYGDVSTSVWGDSNANRSDRYRACVAFLDGIHPSAVMMRGYYSGSFAVAYDFDGEKLVKRWYHKSSTKGQGTYGEGHHSVTVGDVDGDGFDEIVVGSACIDHDGSTLWRTGTGHGDALHLGDFDPENEGMEVFAVYESKSAAYDATLRDAKTGKVLASTKQTNSDTGRGLIMDIDWNHPGAEFMHSSSSSLYDIEGSIICPWQQGTVGSSSINFRIYWDGDLFDEYHDRQHIDKWNADTQSYGRMVTLYNEGGASSINSSKYNPNLQADILGDWREEAIYWVTESDGTQALTIFTTRIPTEFALPTLRDDHVYDMAIVWQNVGYNQPPHLSFSPLDYFSSKKENNETGEWLPFYADYNMDLPKGVEMYYVRGYSKVGVNDTVLLNKVDGEYIPAKTPVLLHLPTEAAAEYKFTPSGKTSTVPRFTSNYLRGISASDTIMSATEGTVSGEYFYEFRKDEELGYGFFLIEEKVLPENTSYLRVKETSTFKTHAPHYLLASNLQPNRIESIKLEDIKEGMNLFDLTGRRVLKPQRGIYLMRGKIVVVK